METVVVCLTVKLGNVCIVIHLGRAAFPAWW